MNVLEAAVCAIGEIAAYVIGRIAGYSFHLEPKKAQTIGEYVVIGVIVGSAVFVTLVYS
jgi:hypothetical protein